MFAFNPAESEKVVSDAIAFRNQMSQEAIGATFHDAAAYATSEMDFPTDADREACIDRVAATARKVVLLSARIDLGFGEGLG